MKKILFSKLPLLLGGMMVLLTGCVKRADFEALTDRVAVLEASLPDIQEQIDALNSSISSLEDFDKSLVASIDELKEADQDIADRITNLQSSLQEQISALDTRLSGEISDLKTATTKNAGDIASLLETVGAIEGNLSKLGDTYATDAELKAAVDELNAAIEQVKSDLTKTLGDSFNEALKGYATTAALKELQDELGKIDLDQIKADYEKAINQAIDEALANDGKITNKVKDMISTAIKSLETRLAAVEGQVKELLARIQSIVFVPEYTDGMATINYAKVGSDVIEAQSKFTFQVYPAECALALKKEFLSFCFKDVQSRANERRLEVVNCVADSKTGKVDVYANARDFAADFYKDTPTTHYAVSLVVDDAEAINIASSYVNLVAIDEADADVITAEVVNTADTAYKIEYTDLTAKDILKEHQLKFKIGGGTEQYSLEEMRGMGYDISVSPTVSYVYSDDSKASLFNNVSKKVEDHIYTVVNLTNKTTKNDVGVMETVTCAYSVGSVEVANVSATVEIVKIQRAIELSVEDIVWVYAEDAESDVTGNTLSLDAATLIKTTVPNDTTWENIVAAPSTSTIKVDGVAATGVTATFGGTTSARTLELAGFAWGKEYSIEVVYELPNIEVAVSTTVKTVDRSRQVVELKLADAEYDIAQNLEFTTAAESLTALYDGVKSYLGGMTAADYLKEVLVTKTTGTGVYAVSNKISGVEYANSKLNVAADGLTAQASYLYSDMTATPDVVEYVYEVTTWYGQKFVVTKSVTIDKQIRTYDFEHVPTWVFENPYKSVITHEYTYSNEALRNASAFSLKNIVMNDAFLVKDNTGNTLTIADLATLGITLEYVIEDSNVPSSLMTIDANGNHVFAYETKAQFVNIAGRLKLATGVGSEVIDLPTQFSVGNYVDYRIEGNYPIEDHITKSVVDAAGNSLTYIPLVEAKNYDTYVWERLSINDDREFPLFENGAWVVGNDNNGFASGSKPCDASIYNAKMKFEIVKIENLPAEQAGKVTITPESGILTFNYTNKFVAAKPIYVTVKATLECAYQPNLEVELTYTFQTK